MEVPVGGMREGGGEGGMEEGMEGVTRRAVGVVLVTFTTGGGRVEKGAGVGLGCAGVQPTRTTINNHITSKRGFIALLNGHIIPGNRPFRFMPSFRL